MGVVRIMVKDNWDNWGQSKNSLKGAAILEHHFGSFYSDPKYLPHRHPKSFYSDPNYLSVTA